MPGANAAKVRINLFVTDRIKEPAFLQKLPSLKKEKILPGADANNLAMRHFVMAAIRNFNGSF